MNTSSPSVDHDIDVYAWISHNAELLREGRLSEIDRMNIAEELDSMGRSIKRELGSRLLVLLANLLKWRYQPHSRGNSWRLTIRNQSTEIRELLEESPSLIAGIESYLFETISGGMSSRRDRNGIVRRRFSCRLPVRFG